MSTIDPRAERLYQEHIGVLHRRTDLMFAALLIVQWMGGILAALFISPRTWAAGTSSTHVHVWTALGLGTALLAIPLLLVMFRRGEPITRYTIAIAQMLFSALLIHLTGGRLETHFHVFGSLAFLAIYRDWRVLIPATAVVAADHVVRGLFWPESVFGVLSAGLWRALEHAGWVIFEDIFLIYGCVQATREMRTIASTRATLEQTNESIEEKIRIRTRELRQRTAELDASQQRFNLAIEGSRDAIWDWDIPEDRMYYSDRWKQMLCDANETVTDSPKEWFGRILSISLSAFQNDLASFVDGETDALDAELAMRDAAGETRWVRCRAAAVRDAEGRAVRLAGSLSDVTELREANEALRMLAQHDRLTGLPNRELFGERVAQAVARVRRAEGEHFAVLFLDFDRFKLINDSLGHDVGDALLKSIGDRRTKSIREVDTAARFGGDEFVVLIERLADPVDAEIAASHLLAAMEEPHQIDSHEIVSTASIGIALSSGDTTDAASMIRDADAAMYQAKVSGKAQFKVFDSDMHATASRRLRIEQDMRLAIDAGQFEMWYQPIVSLETGAIVGFESLVRWNHPERGIVTPDEFIPVAEETGLIIPIGMNAMREAAINAQKWAVVNGNAPYVNVNLSRKQLIHPEMIDMLRRVLDETGIAPDRFCLEVTESTVMDPRHSVVPAMKRIKELGVGLAMDDFGTGHSSLSCLHSFPIDVLKVDRDFVRNMTRRYEFTAVMHAIVTLAGHLNLPVVAEGIETRDQLAQLQGMECLYGQGYLFSAPVPAREVPALLAKPIYMPLAA